MNGLLVFIRKDLGEMLHNRAFFMMLLVAGFLVYMMTNSIGGGIDSIVKQSATDAELYDTVQSMTGMLVIMLVFIVMLLVCLYMNAYTVLLEKTKRSIESLLCTPVKLKQLWFGKVLATFIPSFFLGLLLAAGTLIVMNIVALEPEVGRWVIPGPAALVTAIIIMPVIVFLLSSLIVMLQLIMQNVRLIQGVFTALVFGSSFGLSYAFRLASAEWNIVYITAGVACLLGMVVWLLSGRLTKERIVLTSKG